MFQLSLRQNPLCPLQHDAENVCCYVNASEREIQLFLRCPQINMFFRLLNWAWKCFSVAMNNLCENFFCMYIFFPWSLNHILLSKIIITDTESFKTYQWIAFSQLFLMPRRVVATASGQSCGHGLMCSAQEKLRLGTVCCFPQRALGWEVLPLLHPVLLHYMGCYSRRFGRENCAWFKM